MKRSARFFAAFMLATILATSAEAVTATPVAKGEFLEGVIFIGQNLYFVDYSASDVLRLDGDKIVKVWHQDGCGANGLVATADRLLVACYEGGTVETITLEGRVVKTIRADDDGHRFVSPNDLVADTKGGFYLTTSGGGGRPGTVAYLTPDNHVRTVATGISNANGIALTPDGKQLYIGESGTGQVPTYAIEFDGALGARKVFARLSDVLSGGLGGKYAPDGIRTDRAGNLFICLYRGGGLAVLSPEGRLLQQVDVPGAHHTSLGHLAR